MTNEWLEIFTNLWSEEEPAYSGDYYSYDGIFFEPKPGSAAAHTDMGRRAYAPRIAPHRQVRRRLASIAPVA